MRNLPSRYDAEEFIMDAAVARLLSRLVDGQPLEDVNTISRGDAESTNPKDPIIWIGEGETRALPEERAIQFSDRNTFDLVLQSEVRDRRPEKGTKRARRLAAIAGEQLLRGDDGIEDFRLGLGRWVHNIQFVRSGKGPSSRANSVYSHLGVYRITYEAKR